jgi:hypothetical protein
MNKINSGLFAVALMLVATVAHAGTVRLAGNVGNIPAGMHSGSIDVVLDLDSGDTLQNGGVAGLTVLNSNPGLIKFTTSTVINGGRWSGNPSAIVSATGDSVVFNSSSVSTPALSPGGAGVVFATINWEQVGVATGQANLTFAPFAEETFYDGVKGGGTDVTVNYQGQANFIFIPEPATLAMVGMSLVGLAFRRRNG